MISRFPSRFYGIYQNSFLVIKLKIWKLEKMSMNVYLKIFRYFFLSGLIEEVSNKCKKKGNSKNFHLSILD